MVNEYLHVTFLLSHHNASGDRIIGFSPSIMQRRPLIGSLFMSDIYSWRRQQRKKIDVDEKFPQILFFEKVSHRARGASNNNLQSRKERFIMKTNKKAIEEYEK